MNSGRETCLDRRNVLKATSGVIFGTAALGQFGSVSAQNAAASVTINTQESDGDSIVIASLQTEVDARLYITPVRDEDDNLIHKRLDLSAGTSFTNRTVELDRPMQESKTVSAVIQAGDGYDEVIASDTALIAVGESIAAARSSQVPGTIEKVPADSAAGFNWPYLLYTPSTSGSNKESDSTEDRPLVVGNSPWRGVPSDTQRRLESGMGHIANGRLGAIATELNSPGLVALIPSRAEDGSYQNLRLSGSAFDRLDLQLLAMVDDARKRLADQPYTVPEKFHVLGFSSNGRFFDKFTALHPERINALSAGGNGIVVLPVEELTEDIPTAGTPTPRTVSWPVGIADLPELIGEEFNKDAWYDTNQFWYIGAEDQSPEHPRTYVHKLYKGDGEMSDRIREIFGSLQVDDRFKTSQAIFEQLGAPAEFTAYPGVGHTITSQMGKDIITFHRRHKHEEFGPQFTRRIEWPSGPFTVGETLSITAAYENLGAAEATATATLSVDGSTVNTTEVNIAPGEVKRVEFEHSFTSPGEYTVSVDNVKSKSFEVTAAEGGTDTSDDTSSTSGSGQSESTAVNQPGFTLAQTITTIGGISYVIKRRLSDTSE